MVCTLICSWSKANIMYIKIFRWHLFLNGAVLAGWVQFYSWRFLIKSLVFFFHNNILSIAKIALVVAKVTRYLIWLRLNCVVVRCGMCVVLCVVVRSVTNFERFNILCCVVLCCVTFCWRLHKSPSLQISLESRLISHKKHQSQYIKSKKGTITRL